MIKKELIAMILAGGQGSRLKSLTRKIAKPAVPYGGKFRIIDFALSNCANSDIDTVGILTQYQPLILNSHVGIGIPWDLDRRHGGVRVLPPYMSEKGGRWYLGTANAIYENMNFIEMYDPEYVLILSGDHIYKMNYSKMLKFHKAKGADVTISVIEVPFDEANRFGILNTNPDLSIYEFEEKPQNPKNNLASMGIYIFTWKALKRYLEMDSEDDNSDHDFGKNIIPNMLADGLKMYGYIFKGYWKDVGTIASFWQGNMDLLDNDEFDMYDKTWRIYTENEDLPAHYIGPCAVVENALVNEGCEVLGEVRHSVLFTEVSVGENAEVNDSVIFPNVKIGAGAKINKAIVMGDFEIAPNAVIEDPEGDIILVGNPEDSLFFEK
ncbi:MAG: glucose-1-phosphate adenylyltransferase [Clostridiales bacterium]|nr:MAG: glucose-1-phosphate adenylyltransferase [Clostridiales bacterium]